MWRRGNQPGLANEDREDPLQDVLMKYFQAWPVSDAHANVAALFETTTSNAIIDGARAAERRPTDNFAEGEEDPVSLASAAMRSPQLASAPAVGQKV